MKSLDPDRSNHPTAQLICDIQFNSRCCTWLAGWLAKYVDQSMGAWWPPQPDITHFHLDGLRFIFQPSGPTCSSKLSFKSCAISPHPNPVRGSRPILSKWIFIFGSEKDNNGL